MRLESGIANSCRFEFVPSDSFVRVHVKGLGGVPNVRTTSLKSEQTSNIF